MRESERERERERESEKERERESARESERARERERERERGREGGKAPRSTLRFFRITLHAYPPLAFVVFELWAERLDVKGSGFRFRIQSLGFRV